MREADRERQKREWEMKERQAEEQRTREEELRRRQQEEMAIRIRRQEEELHRRQQENNLFMQVRWVIKFKMFAILYFFFFFNSIFRLSCTYNCIVLYSRNRQFAVVAKVMILSVATIVMVMVNLMVSNEFLFQKDRKMRLRRDITTHSCIVHVCTSSKPYD